MIRLSDIQPGATWPPPHEAVRVGRIRQERDLYHGRYASLGLQVDNDTVAINMFRRLATIYPDFLFSEDVSIMTGNEGLDTLIEVNSAQIMDSLYFANIDALRHGVGVVTTGNEDMSVLKVVEPDRWFMVVDDAGHIIGDVTVEHEWGTGGNYEPSQTQLGAEAWPDLPNVLEFSMNDYQSNMRMVRAYKYDGNHIGEMLYVLEDMPIQEDMRQVALLYNGYVRDEVGQSAYTDIRPIVRSMIKSATALSKTIERNARPHLFGPAGVLEADSAGNYNLNVEGTYFPLNPEDTPPGYLQWDSNVEAITYERQRNMQDFYFITGLSPILFEADANRNIISGAALRRMLIPFVSRLERIRATNDGVISEVVRLLNGSGAEVMYPFDASNLMVEWGYRAIFEDGDGMNTDEEMSDE